MDKQMLEIIELAESLIWERDRHDPQEFLIAYGRLIQAAKSATERQDRPMTQGELLAVIKHSRQRNFATRH